MSNELITTLAENVAWQSLLADPSLFPEIREGHVTVYYRGRALLPELRLDGDRLTVNRHRNYVPVLSSKKYVLLNWNS